MINLTISCDTSASCTTLSPVQNGVTASDTAPTHNHAEINDLLMTYSRSKETNVLNEVTIYTCMKYIMDVVCGIHSAMLIYV